MSAETLAIIEQLPTEVLQEIHINLHAPVLPLLSKTLHAKLRPSLLPNSYKACYIVSAWFRNLFASGLELQAQVYAVRQREWNRDAEPVESYCRTALEFPPINRTSFEAYLHKKKWPDTFLSQKSLKAKTGSGRQRYQDKLADYCHPLHLSLPRPIDPGENLADGDRNLMQYAMLFTRGSPAEPNECLINNAVLKWIETWICSVDFLQPIAWYTCDIALHPTDDQGRPVHDLFFASHYISEKRHAVLFMPQTRKLPTKLIQKLGREYHYFSSKEPKSVELEPEDQKTLKLLAKIGLEDSRGLEECLPTLRLLLQFCCVYLDLSTRCECTSDFVDALGDTGLDWLTHLFHGGMTNESSDWSLMLLSRLYLRSDKKIMLHFAPSGDGVRPKKLSAIYPDYTETMRELHHHIFAQSTQLGKTMRDLPERQAICDRRCSKDLIESAYVQRLYFSPYRDVDRAMKSLIANSRVPSHFPLPSHWPYIAWQEGMIGRESRFFWSEDAYVLGFSYDSRKPYRISAASLTEVLGLAVQQGLLQTAEVLLRWGAKPDLSTVMAMDA